MTAAPFVAGPRVVTSDHVEIATYDLGGDGPPVLLAHATGFHGRVWLPVAAALADRYRCWSFDFRGHGDSDPAPGGNYDWDGFGRDVLAVADSSRGRRLAGLPRAVGHSAGGAAVLLAEEAQPGTFAALYCYEPVVPIYDGPPVAPAENPLADGARRRREVFESRPAALANYAAKAPFATFDRAVLAAYVEWGFRDLPDGTVQLVVPPPGRGPGVRGGVAPPGGLARLPRVACPVTLASGGRQAHFGMDAMTASSPSGSPARPARIRGPLERPRTFRPHGAAGGDRGVDPGRPRRHGVRLTGRAPTRLTGGSGDPP